MQKFNPQSQISRIPFSGRRGGRRLSSSATQVAWCRAVCRVLVLAILLLALFSAPPVASAQDSGFKIIVHKTNPATSMAKREISSLFLKKTTQWEDKTTVLPVDLVADSAVRKVFTDEIHRRKVPAVKNYWAQSIFAGRADPPPEMAGEAAVLEYVANNPGAVGYVSQSANTGSVKVLKIED